MKTSSVLFNLFVAVVVVLTVLAAFLGWWGYTVWLPAVVLDNGHVQIGSPLSRDPSVQVLAHYKVRFGRYQWLTRSVQFGRIPKSEYDERTLNLATGETESDDARDFISDSVWSVLREDAQREK